MATLNRVITLLISDESTRNEHGETVPGKVNSYTVWAEVRDGGSSETLTVAGSRIDARKSFTVRWRRDIIDARTQNLRLTDEYGRAFTITEFSEAYEDGRRRYVDLFALAVA